MNKNTISKQCLQVLDVKSAKMKKNVWKKIKGIKDVYCDIKTENRSNSL